MKSFALYPEYAVSDAEKEGLANEKSVKVEVKHFVSLPCEEAHSGYPTGHAAGYRQKLNPHVSHQKWSQAVSQTQQK